MREVGGEMGWGEELRQGMGEGWWGGNGRRETWVPIPVLPHGIRPCLPGPDLGRLQRRKVAK